ncbi:MAG: sensor histidine kinase [Thermoclostridium sp.]|nr:sensor histidine kinase [Thermoclostridium sp.]
MKVQARFLGGKVEIFIFCAVILLFTFSFFAFLTIKISNRAIVEKAMKNAGRELALIDRSLLNLTNNVENYLRILSIDNRLQGQLQRIESNELDSIDNLELEKTLSSASSNVVEPITHIVAASIISAHGSIFDVGYVDNTSIYQHFTPDVINDVKQKKTPSWLGLIRMEFKYGGEADAFALAKPIIGMDTGHYLGTVVLYLAEKDLASMYLDNIVNQNDKFYVVDEHKRIISTQNKSELYQPFEEEKYLKNYRLEEISDVQSFIHSIDGKQALITVTGFEKLNWNIISITQMDEITDENKNITTLIILFGVICLLFAFAASYLLSYKISRPILKLVNIMKEIQTGNLKLRANFKAKDEIGMLGEGFNSLMDKINQLMEQIYLEQKLKRENEFKLLQSQIKPHFLYNTIETIISFIKLDLKDNAMMAAKYLAGFYRISLSKGKDIITIKDELHLIENYLSIQKLRYVEYLDFKVEVDEEIYPYQIPRLTLQPLVENSIYHGLKQKEDKGILTIKGRLEEEIVTIDVIDDGIGISDELITRILSQPDSHHKNSDFGLYSVNSRIKLLYGDQYGIRIESKMNEYTKVTVILPASLA